MNWPIDWPSRMTSQRILWRLSVSVSDSPYLLRMRLNPNPHDASDDLRRNWALEGSDDILTVYGLVEVKRGPLGPTNSGSDLELLVGMFPESRPWAVMEVVAGGIELTLKGTQ